MKEVTAFKHKSEIEIRFVDIDAFGHVNNAHYLTYIEQARVQYFDQLVGWKYDWSKQGIILARAEVDFIEPVEFRDTIEIYTRCSRIGNKSFDLDYLIVKADNGENRIKANAKSVQVTFDYEKNESIAIPEEWVKVLKAYEGL